MKESSPPLTLYRLVLSADNFYKQFRPRSDLTKGPTWSSHSKGILKEFFENVDFEKNQEMTKQKTDPVCKEFS